MTENEALELGKFLYENITNNANNIIPKKKYIEFVGMAIQALEEIQQYRAIGTVERFNFLQEVCDLNGDKLENISNSMIELKNYRAIGTTEEFKALKEHMQIIQEAYENTDGYKDGYAKAIDEFAEKLIKKIGEYEDAEEQGLLLKLPCKVGDTVYELQEVRKRIQPMEIISVNIGRMGLLYFNWELKDGIGIYHNVKGFGTSQIGKTVFLTREEAEQALEAMKGGAE